MKGLVIGRFQPFHCGHYRMINWVRERCDELTIGIGSSNKHDSDNPYYFGQRRDMIWLSYPMDVKFDIVAIPDFGNEKKWVKWIQDNIEFDILFSNSQRELRIFKEAGLKTEYIEYEGYGLHGTDIRKLLHEIKSNVPKGTWRVLTGN